MQFGNMRTRRNGEARKFDCRIDQENKSSGIEEAEGV